MAPKPNRISVRISDEGTARLAELQKAWGPIVPLSQADVIEHALHVALQAEHKKNLKNRQTVVDID